MLKPVSFEVRSGWEQRRLERDDGFRWHVFSEAFERGREEHFEFEDIAATEVDITRQGIVYTQLGIVYTCVELDGPMEIIHAHMIHGLRLWHGEGLHSRTEAIRSTRKMRQGFHCWQFSRVVERLSEEKRYQAQLYMTRG